ncbi:HD domain-containing protein [Stenotrophomonas sp. MH181796]|uniref:HD domain-containing protein n=1 Tax=Stenotrophomonas sp. MH181796 TaxID=2339228 RepID=UPI00129D1376|nr:HD domain-containing protein [Stenotrophomonas sp. MH181796]MRI43498.1 HD domain-containing protein [Stenotrophomonas sp. MH181796]
MDWVAQARALATEAHAGQQDKAGHPYIEHVARVAAAIRDDDMAKAAAWLHDVVKDCPDFADRMQAFPPPIRDTVNLLSRHSAQDATHYYARIREHPLALKVKLADIADNAHPRRLRQLAPALAERLRGKYSMALAALGQRQSSSDAGSGATPQQRLQHLMEAACSLEQCVGGPGSTTGTRDTSLSAHHAALIRVRDIVLAELETQMEPVAFAIWSDMHIRA